MIPIAASAAISAASSLANLVGSAASDSTSSPTAAQPPKDGNVVNQADFMQLLITQLQNQDPLNPMDSANFSAQLAQFSSLQQLTEINQTLKGTGKTSDGTSRFDAVSFLGKDVRGASDVVALKSGVASTLDYTLPSAGTVRAKIVDASGRTVADLVLGAESAGAHTFDLESLSDVPQLADGDYKVRISVGDGTGTATAVATTGGGIVTGVDLAGDTPVLLIGDRRLALTDVRQVQDHAPTTN